MALHKEEELAKKWRAKSEGNHSSLQGPNKSTLVGQNNFGNKIPFLEVQNNPSTFLSLNENEKLTSLLARKFRWCASS